MDKELLKKHHFWILLALAVVLIPVVMGGAVFGVGAAAKTEKDAIDKKLSDLKSQSPKSVQYIDELEKQKTVLEGQRDKLWAEVYEAQKGLIVWPETYRKIDPITYERLQKDAYFGDKLPDEMRSVYRNDLYYPMYAELPPIMEPTQFIGRNWSQVLQYVNWLRDPTDEECWLSLETLCVQRELLNDIQAVNKMLSDFKPVPDPNEKPPTDEAERKAFDARIAREKTEVAEARKKYNVRDDEAFGRFISPYWQLDLVIERSKKKNEAGVVVCRGEIINLSGHRQNLAQIDFKVWTSDRVANPNIPPIIVPIQHEYLAAKDPNDKEKLDYRFAFEKVSGRGSLTSNKITAVEQKLDLRFVPVKRLDKLVLSYVSHRHGDRTLVPASGVAFEEAKKAAEAVATAAPTDGLGPRGGDMGPMGGPGGPGGPGGMAAVDATPNGVPRSRYLGRSDQVRWMPIAVTMIVDQAHIQDIVRAFANSKLRFQATQMHFARFRGPLGLGVDSATGRPEGGDDMAPDGPPRGGPGGGMMRGGPPRGGSGDDAIGAGPGRGGPPRGPGGFPGGGPGGFPGGGPGGRFGGGAGGPMGGMGPAGSAEEEGPNNLVEVTIYGIASLYEKYPPRKPADAAATPPAPGTPEPSTPATPPATPAAPLVTPTPAPTTPAPTTPAPNTPPPPPTPPAPPPSPMG